MSCEEIAGKLNRSYQSVMSKARVLQLKKTKDQISAILVRNSRDQTGTNNPNWKGGSELTEERGRVGTSEYKLENPEKALAHTLVSLAKDSGELVMQPCEVCGVMPTQAHHDDYSKPLEVRWLCVTHHIRLHHLGRRKEKQKVETHPLDLF
jgi:hypothetical protein